MGNGVEGLQVAGCRLQAAGGAVWWGADRLGRTCRASDFGAPRFVQGGSHVIDADVIDADGLGTGLLGTGAEGRSAQEAAKALAAKPVRLPPRSEA